MKNILRRILIFLGLLLVIAVLSVGPEFLPDEVKDKVQGFIGEDYFAPVLIGSMIVALLISVFWSEGDKIFGPSKSDGRSGKVEEDVLADIREGLEESYQSRIDSKLAYRFPINLQLSYSKEGTTTREDLINRSVKAYGASTIKEELIKIFDKQGGRLLIIGEPGAGKTTIMLQLALKLLERKEEQVPVLVNIATWRSRFKNVEEWFEELLPQMGFSKGLVKVMLEENRILPLFDGLDELAEEDRDGCLAAIAYYGKRQSIRYVICSRIEEYANAADAPVFCQVMVKPLTLKQIKSGLKETNSPEANSILDAIRKDPLLAEAIETPFYLNTMQLLFASMKGVGEFGFVAGDVEGRKREIVEAFVSDATKELKGYDTKDAMPWLGFLADRMERRGLVEIELAKMQYDWIRLRKQGGFWGSLVYGIVHGLVEGIAFGLVIGLVFGLIYSLLEGLDLVLIFFLLIGLLIGLLNGLFTGLLDGLGKVLGKSQIRIEVKGKTKWSLTRCFYYFRQELFSKLLFGLVGGLFIGFLGGFGKSLIVDVGIVLSFALSLHLTNSIHKMMRNDFKNFLKIGRPYQRFQGSMWSFHFSILQHWHLCHLLRKKGLLPRRYPDFLKAATEQNILESDGGSWRFRHRILQEYFVDMWQEKYGEDEDLKDGISQE